MSNICKLLILLVVASTGLFAAEVKTVPDKDKLELIKADNAVLNNIMYQNKLVQTLNQQKETLAKLQSDLNKIADRILEANGIPKESKADWSFNADFDLVKAAEAAEKKAEENTNEGTRRK